MGRGLALVALLLVGIVQATVLTVAGQEGTLPSGPIYVGPENMTVTAGSTLRIGPDTSLSGPGQLQVFGTLLVEGRPDATANFTVPIIVLQGGRAELRHAHLWTVKTTALDVEDAEANLSNVLLDGNDAAIRVTGASALHAVDVTLRDNVGEALRVEGAASVEVERASFTGNGRAVTVYSARRLLVNDSSFVGNGEHLVVDLGPWSAPGEIGLARNRFGPPASTPAQLPGILLRHDTPIVQDDSQSTVRMDSNRIEGAPVGLRAEGRGLVVLSTNDTLVNNTLGLSVQLATVRIDGGTFGNDRDVEGSGRVTLNGITYLRQGAPAATDAAARAPWLPWALGAAVALLALGAVLIPRLARKTPSPPPSPPPSRSLSPSLPPPESQPQPTASASAPLDATVSSVERRILEDILAHPGTAQRAVADRLGTTRQALHYHVKKLEARGLVLKSVEGRETRCTVPHAVALALAATPTRTESQEKA